MEKSIDDVIDLFERKEADVKRQGEAARKALADALEAANNALITCVEVEILPAMELAEAKLQNRGYPCMVKIHKDVHSETGKTWYRTCGLGVVVNKDLPHSGQYIDYISNSISFIPDGNRRDVRIQTTVKGDDPATLFTIMDIGSVDAATVKRKITEFLDRAFSYHLGEKL